MSDLKRLTLVTSANELADFPTHFAGSDAEELLAGWTALWHPVLLATARALPTIRADHDLPDPSSLQGELAVIPTMFDRGDVTTWREQLRLHPNRHLISIEGVADRRQIIAAALAALGQPTDPVDPDLTADFFALGYAFLQVEMLTRLMRYSHLIEPEKLLNAVLTAATAAIEGRAEPARESIAAACDMLTQARNHYYPVDVHFVDVALLAKSVWGAPLREELAAAPWLNVLATGEQLEQLAQVEPETASALRAALVAKPQTAGLIGGCYTSGPLCDRAPETLLADLMRGRQISLDTFGHAPQVFAHFNAGLAPLLPRLLSDFGFRGALLAAFDGGQMPRADQCRTRWTGPDGALVEALVTTPLDAGQAETFLSMAEAISRSMDRDHVATILLAGWPGHGSPYLEDLRRITRFGPVLGRFVTLNDYFDTTVASDFGFTAKLDDYAATPRASDDSTLAEITETHNQLLTGLADIAAASTPFSRDAEPPSLPETGRGTAERAIDSIAKVLNTNSTAATGLLAVNAWNFERTLQHDSDTSIPHVPGFGFAIAERNTTPPPVPLVEGLRLRNEFLEVLLDERTGGIQSVHLHGQRGNHLSQQLVYRGVYRHPDEYVSDLHEKLIDLSQMRVDQFVPTDSAHEAAITAIGRLVTLSDEPLAAFRQTIHLPRHTRVIRFDIELTPEGPETEAATAGHFASRIAWRDADVELARSVQWLNLPTTRRKFSATPWAHIDTPTPLTIIPIGSADLERISPRMLDSLVPNEGSYSLAVTVGEPFPATAALGLLTANSPRNTTGVHFESERKGWWLHLAAENLVVTHLSLAAGEPSTIELRAIETMGVATSTTLRLWRPAAEAHRISLAGERLEPLTIADGHVQLQIAPYEWFGVGVTWADA